jgi:hypothetical protein
VRSLRRSPRLAVTEHGMAYGARALRLRSPNSSRGRDAPPGRTRESFTGRSGTGDSIHRNREVREMRNADTVLGIIQDRGGPRSWRRGVARRSWSVRIAIMLFSTVATMDLRSRTGVTGEPRDTESGHAWFGGGPLEKYPSGQLAGGLSYFTYGSVSGSG